MGKHRASTPSSAETKPTEAAESRLLIEYAFDMAAKLGIKNVVVRADQLQDRRLVERCRSDETVVWLVRREHEVKGKDDSPSDVYVEIPGGPLARIDEVTVGLTAAVLQNKLKVDDSAICLTGVAGSNRLDNLLVVNPRRDLPWFRVHEINNTSSRIASKEGIRLIDIALRFASEGREGKPIGTIFVMGSYKEVASYTRPLILNPLAGHEAEIRSIHNQDFFETLRELSAIDGAFIINTRGVVEEAGVFLNAPVSKKVAVKPGLGARHLAAAAVSAQTGAMAVVISESSGVVTIFSDGAAVLELEGRG